MLANFHSHEYWYPFSASDRPESHMCLIKPGKKQKTEKPTENPLERLERPRYSLHLPIEYQMHASQWATSM